MYEYFCRRLIKKIKRILAEKMFVLQTVKVCGTVQIWVKVCQTMKNCAKVCITRQIFDILHRFSIDWYIFAHFSTLWHSLAHKVFNH